MRVLVLLLLTALPLPAGAQVAARLADLRLETAVRLALVAEARTRGLDVAVAARDGAVTVSGEVPAALRSVAGEVARGVPGVRQVSGLGDGAATAPVPIRDRPADRPAPPRAPREPVARDPAPAASGAAYHTVERGDTVFSLARRYDTTVQALLDLNGLSAPDIRIGQRLRVR